MYLLPVLSAQDYWISWMPFQTMEKWCTHIHVHIKMQHTDAHKDTHTVTQTQTHTMTHKVTDRDAYIDLRSDV